jgi:hypothetical protein
MRRLMVLLVLAVAAGPLAAQTVPPALFVQDGEKKLVPLNLTAVRTEVRIHGYLAETKMTLTFGNPHNRALAGDLYFPLPEGATVSGYALDVNGKMVDGSVVEKTKGRVVFEKIVRAGIDPGLVEWVKGNNFKTRVFPIPARGSRTIRVEYVADLLTSRTSGGDPVTAYHLPLNFTSKVGEFSLRVEVVKAAAEPKVAAGGLANFQFKQWQESFVAETTLKDAKLTEDLVVALPQLERQPVQVEKGPEGRYHFVVHDFPRDPRGAEARRTASRIGHVAVFWDASGSRAGKGRDREIEMLTAFVKQAPGGKITVDLILLRNEQEPLRRFKLTGDAAPLAKALRQIAYDGGTQLGALHSPYEGEGPDAFFLFTDGVSNFGREEPAALGSPLYIFSADATANHTFLRYLSLKHGGRYFNLTRLDDAAVLSAIGDVPFSFLAAEADGAEIADTWPQRPVPVAGRFTLAGRLKGKQAKITLKYGVAGRILASSTFTVSREQAAKGNLIRRYWAQKRVDELMLFAKRNEKEIVRVGKRYKLVTPFTSLIVLESLEQYVEHRIAPPDSLPQMQKQYEQRVAKILAQETQKKQSKLKRVLALWEQRVKWWQTEFKYAKDFKYRGSDRSRGGALGGQTGARPAARMPSPGAPPPRTAPAPDAAPGPRPAEEPQSEARDGDERADALEQSGLALGARRAEGKEKDSGRRGGPAIALKPWNPDTPYLKELARAKGERVHKVYLELRTEYGTSPAFFLDCGEFFLKAGDKRLALRVLSNIAELELENAALLRVLAHKLAQIGELELAELLFEEALRLRPEEPQSFRDLALVVARRADQARGLMRKDKYVWQQDEALRRRIQAGYRRAIDLLYKVVLGEWDRFAEIELIALMELNALVPKAKGVGVEDFDVDERLVKLLDVDCRIILTWDADLTDMDLWVIEPSGEKAYYGHRRTTIGGNFSRDFTQGYGPEEYCLRAAMGGKYTIKVNYYGSRAVQLIGSVTLQVDVFTNYGRPNETRKSMTLRLTQKKETVTIGQIEF